jgi:hypothetical protein
MAKQPTGNIDLFGEPILRDVLLRDVFLEPPFTILDRRGGAWKNRARLWKSKGIKSEVGRDATAFNMEGWHKKRKTSISKLSDKSIFDPVLCELMYRWFCPDGGKIIDPFAGGSVRGIVANYLGFDYTGIDIRPEQIESNKQQGREIVPDNVPKWICGDSAIVIPRIASMATKRKPATFDMLFTCPPYADLEIYSTMPGDISNMKYPDFLKAYRMIIADTCALLKPSAYAVIVVGEVRDKRGGMYVGFVPDTVRAFVDAGLQYYNEAVLLDHVGDAAMRANRNMKYQKLVKVHQNVLIFKKP